MKLQEIFTDPTKQGLDNMIYFKTIPGTELSYEVLTFHISRGLESRISNKWIYNSVVLIPNHIETGFKPFAQEAAKPTAE